MHNFCQAMAKQSKLLQVSFSQMEALGDVLRWKVISCNTGSLMFCAISSVGLDFWGWLFSQPAARSALREAVNPSYGLPIRDFWEDRISSPHLSIGVNWGTYVVIISNIRSNIPICFKFVCFFLFRGNLYLSLLHFMTLILPDARLSLIWPRSRAGLYGRWTTSQC